MAVEAHALNVAVNYCAGRGVVVVTARDSCYDLSLTIDKADWHVTVKRTTGTGEKVALMVQAAFARTAHSGRSRA